MKLFFLLAAVAVFPVDVAFAQSEPTGFTYTFPRVEAPGMNLAIANITTSDAVVRVTFFNPDGTIAATPRFPLAASSQTFLDDSIFAGGAFLGAAVIESTNPLSVTAANSRPDSLETVGPSSSGPDLLIPFVRGGVSANTTVSIFNPNSQGAEAALFLARANGTLLTGPSLVLGPNGGAHVSLSSLGLNLDSVTHVVIRSLASVFSSEKSIFAVATVTDFNAGDFIVRRDAAIIQAVPVSSLTANARIPLFIHGLGYFTQLQVANASNLPQSVTLTAFGANDVPVPTARNPVTISVPANGAFSADMGTLFDLAGEISGSVSIAGTGPLTAIGVLGAQKFQNLAVIEPSEGAVSSFAYQFRSISRSSFFGLSFLNSNPVGVDVSMSFVANDGSTLSRAQLIVPSGSHVTKTLSDLMPEAEGGGYLFVSSSLPIQARTIEGSADGAVLSSLRLSTISPGFNPNQQNRFLAVGTATVEGIPLPGATVRLAGPVFATRITDSVGAFVFRDIPPGQYTLTIEMAGITFTPSSIPFTVTDENSRGHVFAGSILAATLTGVIPGSVLVGSQQSLQITATGGPFIPTSEIVFEGVVLPTTFVNETTITATVGSSAFQLARLIPVQVRNRIGQSFAPSGTVTFVVGNPAPVVTGVTGIPVEIIVGHPGFTATFTGTGFSEGGTVEVDGVARGYVFDSPTQVRAFVGPQDLAIGRVAKLTATNPSPSIGPSNATNITILNPIAGMISISPTTTETKLEPNSPGVQLTVNGFSFKPGATIQVGTYAPLNTTFVSSTTLTAQIPPQALEVGGSFKVSVTNPPPTLGTSEGQPLLVYNLIPTLNSIDTGPLTFQPGPTEATTSPIPSVVVLHGSNFGKTSAVLAFFPTGDFPSCDGTPEPVQVPHERISSRQLIATVPVKCTGTYRIYASSSQLEPGGGVTQVLSFTVTAPPAGTVPLLTSLSPQSTPRGTAFTLTINGTNFLAGAIVNFGTAILVPTSVTATAVTVNIPAYLLQEAGLVPVTVTNPGLGGTSTRLLLTVN